MKDFSEDLKKLPAQPGVYIMRDTTGKVIYVGKSRALKNRVSGYFQESLVKAQADLHFQYVRISRWLRRFFRQCR